jgi:hypothetical protein
MRIGSASACGSTGIAAAGPAIGDSAARVVASGATQVTRMGRTDADSTTRHQFVYMGNLLQSFSSCLTGAQGSDHLSFAPVSLIAWLQRRLNAFSFFFMQSMTRPSPGLMAPQCFFRSSPHSLVR